MYLNISKATMYDAGVYTCVVENSLGRLNRSFELIVQGRSLDRPVFISKSANLTQYEGDNITLECLFYSDSSPFVQWFVRPGSKNQIEDTELRFIKVNKLNIFFFLVHSLYPIKTKQKQILKSNLYLSIVF